MTKKRQALIQSSNNTRNPNQNVCAYEVALFLQVHNNVRYLHKISDLVRAARMRYTVRSRKSSVKGETVGAVRNQLQKLEAKFFILRVEGHVILLDSSGKTLVDTDPRKKDKRKITHLYGVF